MKRIVNFAPCLNTVYFYSIDEFLQCEGACVGVVPQVGRRTSDNWVDRRVYTHLIDAEWVSTREDMEYYMEKFIAYNLVFRVGDLSYIPILFPDGLCVIMRESCYDMWNRLQVGDIVSHYHDNTIKSGTVSIKITHQLPQMIVKINNDYWVNIGDMIKINKTTNND